MNVSEILKNLALDTWYKVLLYIGAILFLLSLVVTTKGITNGQLQLLSSGLFFFGLGEWKNRKVACSFKPSNAYTGPAGILSTKIRQPDTLGMIFDLLGIILFTIGIFSIIKGQL